MKHNNILNTASRWLSIIVVFSITVLFVSKEQPKPMDYVEFRSTYKNCIVVGKTTTPNGNYMLKLCNPLLHKNSKKLYIDYNIFVNNYVYWNIYFIGDTIK